MIIQIDIWWLVVATQSILKFQQSGGSTRGVVALREGTNKCQCGRINAKCGQMNTGTVNLLNGTGETNDLVKRM